MSRILRLSLRSFCSSSVSNDPSSTTEPASGSTLNAIGRDVLLRRRERHRRPVVHQLGGPVDDLAHLLVELVDAGAAAAGDGLVGAGDQPDQAGLVVQRLEHRHRGHRRAVGVGDDALAGVGDRGAVHLADDQRDVRVHPPGRGVVDHDGTGSGEPGSEHPRRRRTGREQRDVEAAEVGGVGVLDGDLAVPPGQRRLPAERAEAKKRSSATGSRARRAAPRMTAPTWPVAPTTPTRRFARLIGRCRRRRPPRSPSRPARTRCAPRGPRCRRPPGARPPRCGSPTSRSSRC